MSKPSLEEILRQSGIPNISVLNVAIVPTYYDDIAACISDWKCVARKCEVDTDEIDEECSRRKAKVVRFLTTWKSQRSNNATYKELATILWDSDYADDTTKLCDLFKKKLLPTQPLPLLQATHQATTTPSKDSGSTSQGSSETGILGEDDQADVEEALENVQGRWRNIGTQLRVKTGRLDEFRTQNLEPSDAMGKVVLEYLKRNYNVERFGAPTWMKIVDAVRKPAGGNNNAEADTIAKKYIGAFVVVKFILHSCDLNI